jgi:hypothetical protein
MGTSGKGTLDGVPFPGLSGKFNRGAMYFVVLQEAAGWMRQG